MRIYLIENPPNYEFARFSHVGVWSKGGVCKECGQGTSVLIEPLLIEWDPDSDLLADFSWCGYVMAVTPKVQQFLTIHGYKCNFGKTEIVAPSKKTKKKRVPFPYEGPQLSWALPTELVSLSEEKSNVRLEIACSVCKQNKYTFKRTGIFIKKSEWTGQKMFRVKQYSKSRATFVTEEALQELKKQNFTNLGYVEAGVID